MPHLPTCGEAAILVSPPGAATPRRPPRERGGTQLNHLPTCGEAGGDVVLGSPPHLWGGRWGRRTWDTSPLVGRQVGTPNGLYRLDWNRWSEQQFFVPWPRRKPKGLDPFVGT